MSANNTPRKPEKTNIQLLVTQLSDWAVFGSKDPGRMVLELREQTGEMNQIAGEVPAHPRGFLVGSLAWQGAAIGQSGKTHSQRNIHSSKPELRFGF